MDNRKRTIALPDDDALPAAPTENAKPKIGDRMPDGTVYAGNLPDTGTPMYTPPADAPLTMKWRDAMIYAAGLETHGHKDWRLPSKAELNVLYNNRAAIGGFNPSGSFPAGHYWSSSEPHDTSAWSQSFSDGFQYFDNKYNGLSARCVRG
jgi:hypothetical protein